MAGLTLSLSSLREGCVGPLDNPNPVPTCRLRALLDQSVEEAPVVDLRNAIDQSLLYVLLSRLHAVIAQQIEEYEEIAQKPTFTDLSDESTSLGLTIQQYLLLLSLIFQMPPMRADRVLSVYSPLTHPRGARGIAFIDALVSGIPFNDDMAAIRRVWWEQVVTKSSTIGSSSFPLPQDLDLDLFAKVIAPRLLRLRNSQNG